MEWTYSIYNVIFSFWMAGVALLFFQVYLPSIQIIKKLQPENIVVKWSWLCSVIWVFFTLFLLPFLVTVLLDDKRKERFMSGFIPSLMGEKDV